MIEIKNLTKKYENITPLENVSTVINDGDVIAIIGPSGTGKSTFLRCINLLENPTSGSIFINGMEITAKDADVPTIRQKMGMVFQNFNLFEHLSIIENIMIAPVNKLGLSKQEAYDRGMELLDKVFLKDKAFEYPDNLSGGQKQRVAIARALAMNPDILLMDEPTSALDPTMIGEVLWTIKNLAETGITMIIVTHEMNFAQKVANRIFYMDQRGIYEDGTPEQIFSQPKGELTRRFIQQIKVSTKKYDFHRINFYELLRDVNTFCHKNLINTNYQMRVNLVLEELIMGSLSKKYENTDMELSMEMSCREDDFFTLHLEYGQEKYDPLQDVNVDDLSKKMIHGMSDDYQFVFHETNKIEVRWNLQR